MKGPDAYDHIRSATVGFEPEFNQSLTLSHTPRKKRMMGSVLNEGVPAVSLFVNGLF